MGSGLVDSWLGVVVVVVGYNPMGLVGFRWLELGLGRRVKWGKMPLHSDSAFILLSVELASLQLPTLRNCIFLPIENWKKFSTRKLLRVVGSIIVPSFSLFGILL